MMDLIPASIDGAVVFNLRNACIVKNSDCENCRLVAIYFHNWIKLSQLEYVVFDLLDEKDICPAFLEEIQQLRKRIQIPFLFAGVMQRPKKVLDQFNYGLRYPLFITPEDAVRALRIQHPGVTECPPRLPVLFGHSFIDTLRSQQIDVGLSL